MIVSDNGLYEALGRSKDEDQPLANLKDEVRAEFKQLDILGEESLLLKRPIRTDQPFLGDTTTHTFSFTQQHSDSGWDVMDVANFVTSKKNLAKDHAGWMAHAFADVKKKYSTWVRPISIVRCAPNDNDPVLRYSLDMLSSESRIVLWQDDQSRKAFLLERMALALKI
jgi:hypothetical protein